MIKQTLFSTTVIGTTLKHNSRETLKSLAVTKRVYQEAKNLHLETDTWTSDVKIPKEEYQLHIYDKKARGWPSRYFDNYTWLDSPIKYLRINLHAGVVPVNGYKTAGQSVGLEA